jgi:hypothetical protein
MAQEVMLLNDQKLNDKILNSSMKTKLEKDVYKMMFKHIKK